MLPRSILFSVPFVILVTIGCVERDQRNAPEVQQSAEPLIRTIADPFTIEMTGSKNQWNVRYPDATGTPAKGRTVNNARLIRVPLNTDVVFVLKSTDYLYSVSVPDLGLKEIAAPKLEFRIQFRPTDPGHFELIGEELCGDPHVRMPVHIVVQPKDRLIAWLNR